MLRKKNITLNGKKASGTEKLAAGDVIRLFFADETLAKFTQPQDTSRYPVRKLDIIYEDDNILLINKPAGMLTQKAESSWIQERSRRTICLSSGLPSATAWTAIQAGS